MFGSFAGRDQICMITRRITVHRKVYAEFTERLLTLAGCLRAGDPAAADTDIGPVGNARRLTAIRDVERGTRVALGLNAAMTHVNDAAVNGDVTDDPGGRRAIGDLTAEHWVTVPLGAGS